MLDNLHDTPDWSSSTGKRRGSRTQERHLACPAPIWPRLAARQAQEVPIHRPGTHNTQECLIGTWLLPVFTYYRRKKGNNPPKMQTQTCLCDKD